MNVEIKKRALKGTVTAPPSKSMAHRMIIAAALSKGTSVIKNVAMSEDIKATLGCVNNLCADVDISKDFITINGGIYKIGDKELYANESGSTLRFLIPLCLNGDKITIRGAGRLFERPLDIYEEICKKENIYFSKDKASLTLQGRLKRTEFNIPGNISSQFITGILFTLPTLKKEGKINVTGSFESRPYVMMTLQAMKLFGVNVRTDLNSFIVPKGEAYKPNNVTVEGDWSNAAFFEALNLFGSDVVTKGLDENSYQGDKVYRELYAKILNGNAEISLKDCPDLAPILFTVAAECGGAYFYDTRRLKIKESDRAAAMKEELSKMGAHINIGENSVTVEKGRLHAPTEPLLSHNDHRIAMALSVALTKYGGYITDAGAVRKSMPDFYDKLTQLGAEVIFDEA